MKYWNSTFRIKRSVVLEAHKNIKPGLQFGDYTVEQRGMPCVGYTGHIMYICRCNTCGDKKLFKAADILRGKAPQCKKCIELNRTPAQGERFGKLTITRLVEKGTAPHKDKYECLCSCGNIITVRWGHLQGGIIKNCGCSQRKTQTTRVEPKKTQKRATLTDLAECGNIKELRKRGLIVWAKLVKAHANHRCELCGREGTDAHHWLFNRSDHSITDITPENGCCLCRTCHIKAHNSVAEYKGKIRNVKGKDFSAVAENEMLEARLEIKTANDYLELIQKMECELKNIKKKKEAKV